MTIYALNIILFSALFWVVYKLLLQKETFFTANRVYLLAAPVLAMALPLLSFEFLDFSGPENLMLQSPEIFISKLTQPQSAQILNEASATASSSISIFQILVSVYGLGILVSLALLFSKLRKLQNLKYIGKTTFLKGQKFISVPKSSVAFTFFGRIFLGENFSGTEKQQILQHELVHVRQKHSWDLLYFEALRVLLWFNPFIYLLQKDSSEVHEFLADRKVSKIASKKSYTQSLLNASFGTQQLSFTNSFFTEHSLKTRILMLHKSKSSRISTLKFLAVIPLVFFMLTYVSCSQDDSAIEETMPQEMAPSPPPPPLAPAPPPPPPKPDPSDFQEDGVPFSMLDKTPEFQVSSKYKVEGERKKAFNTGLRKFILDNFDTEKVQKNTEPGSHRIDSQFTIDKYGEIRNVKVHASNQVSENETKRVINSLPTMIPGERDGEAVNVIYGIPIRFNVR